MIPIIDLPVIVEHYAPAFREVFSTAALLDVEHYFSRLFVLDNRDQSS